MHIDSQESREAHPQIRSQLVPAAGPTHSDSLIPDCDLRGSPAIEPVRAEVDGQPSRRSAKPIPAAIIESILDREPESFVGRFVANDRAPRIQSDPSMGGWPGIIIMLLAAAFIGAMLAIGHAL